MTDPNDKQRQRDRHMRASEHLRSRDEEQQLAEVRKVRASQPRAKRGSQKNSEDGYQKIRRREAVLRPTSKRTNIISNSAQLTGTITWLSRGRALVLCADGERDAVLAPDLARTQQSSVAVGDEVTLFEQIGAEATVVAVAERSSQLVRTDPGNEHRQRVLAANVDIVVLVLSADRPRARAFGLTDAQTDHTAAFEDVLAVAAGELDAARYQAFRNLQ